MNFGLELENDATVAAGLSGVATLVFNRTVAGNGTVKSDWVTAGRTAGDLTIIFGVVGGIDLGRAGNTTVDWPTSWGWDVDGLAPARICGPALGPAVGAALTTVPGIVSPGETRTLDGAWNKIEIFKCAKLVLINRCDSDFTFSILMQFWSDCNGGFAL